MITEVYDRPRPFAHPGAVHLFARHAPDAGFRSDHATAPFAIAVAILLRSKLPYGLATLLSAVVLLFGRVAVGFHYPSDVLAGAAIGSLAAVVLWIQPIRGLVDALSERLGGYWDRGVDAVLRNVGPRRLLGQR